MHVAVDGVVKSARLTNGAPTDCAPTEGADCVMYLGQRSNGQGGTAYQLAGMIHSATLQYE